MKKTSLIALTALAIVASPLSSFAGGGKYVVTDPTVGLPKTTGSDFCYDGGLEFGTYVAGYFPQGGHYDDSLGGGISMAYFFGANLGLDLGATWFDTDSVVHHYTLDAVYRLPFDCIAPYVLVGGGVHTNGSTEGLFRFGGGVDFRVLGSTSIFADGVYTISNDDVEDSTTARLGLRFAF